MGLRGKHRKEPLWWGRGNSNCFALWPNKNGPYHEIFIGNGKTGEAGGTMQLDDRDLVDLAIHIMRVVNHSEVENG